MNVPTIVMERDEALQKLSEYAEAAKRNPKLVGDVDRKLLMGYRALSKGKRLIDVDKAIEHAGLDVSYRPRLAISRAHVEQVHFRGLWQTGNFCWMKQPNWWNERYKKLYWHLPQEMFAGVRLGDGKAQVPYVPLPLRPKTHLHNFFVLFEAVWEPAPPSDPYLLRPLAGSLMEIVAEWELTPIEISAVRQARR